MNPCSSLIVPFAKSTNSSPTSRSCRSTRPAREWLGTSDAHPVVIPSFTGSPRRTQSQSHQLQLLHYGRRSAVNLQHLLGTKIVKSPLMSWPAERPASPKQSKPRQTVRSCLGFDCEVELVGIEPTTSSVPRKHSSQLSYSPIRRSDCSSDETRNEHGGRCFSWRKRAAIAV